MARSRTSQSQQLTLSLFDKADLGDARVNPETVRGGLRDVPAQTKEPTREAQVFDLLEQMVAPPLTCARLLNEWSRIKGAPGVDGMTVDKLRPFLTASQWITLRSANSGGQLPTSAGQTGRDTPTRAEEFGCWEYATVFGSVDPAGIAPDTHAHIRPAFLPCELWVSPWQTGSRRGATGA